MLTIAVIALIGSVSWLFLRIVEAFTRALQKHGYHKAATIISYPGVIVSMFIPAAIAGGIESPVGGIFLFIFIFLIGALVIEPIFWIYKRITRRRGQVSVQP